MRRLRLTRAVEPRGKNRVYYKMMAYFILLLLSVFVVQLTVLTHTSMCVCMYIYVCVYIYIYGARGGAVG